MNLPLKYNQATYSFTAIRKHFFRDVKYFVYVFEDQIIMAQKPDDQSPKYRIQFSLLVQIQFTVEKAKNKIVYKTFAFKYKDRFKDMTAESDHILTMKNIITNKVTFHKIADFYEPQYLIGKGSSANVLLAQKLIDDQKLAVKSIDKSYLYRSDNGMEAFMSEVNILKVLNKSSDQENQYFLKLHEIFEGEQTYYLVMDLMSGKTLQEELDFLKSRPEKNIMKPENTKIIMRRLLEGVNIMHQKNVIHRDLKPDNIMFAHIKDYSSLRIVDFGLATDSTREKYLFPKCGTPGYVAPEILHLHNRSEKYSSACDLFSCGCIFYKLLTGKSLFPGTEFNEVLRLNKNCQFDLTNNSDLANAPKDAIKDPLKRITAKDALKHQYLNLPEQDTKCLSQIITTINPINSPQIDHNKIIDVEQYSPFQKKAMSKHLSIIRLEKVKEDEEKQQESSIDNRDDSKDCNMEEFKPNEELQIQHLPMFKKPGVHRNLTLEVQQLIPIKLFQSQKIVDNNLPSQQQTQQLDSLNSPKSKQLSYSPMHSNQNSCNSFYMKDPLSGMKKARGKKLNDTYVFSVSPDKQKSSVKQRQSQFMEKVNLFNREQRQDND